MTGADQSCEFAEVKPEAHSLQRTQRMRKEEEINSAHPLRLK